MTGEQGTQKAAGEAKSRGEGSGSTDRRGGRQRQEESRTGGRAGTGGPPSLGQPGRQAKRPNRRQSKATRAGTGGGRAAEKEGSRRPNSPQHRPKGLPSLGQSTEAGAAQSRPRSSLGAEAQQHGRGAEAAPYERQAEKPQRAPQRGEEPRSYTQV